MQNITIVPKIDIVFSMALQICADVKNQPLKIGANLSLHPFSLGIPDITLQDRVSPEALHFHLIQHGSSMLSLQRVTDVQLTYIMAQYANETLQVLIVCAITVPLRWVSVPRSRSFATSQPAMHL